MASVYERVRSIVAERLGVDEEKVTIDAEFIGDLNADSLDLVEVIMAMEQEFDIEIKDEKPRTFDRFLMQSTSSRNIKVKSSHIC